MKVPQRFSSYVEKDKRKSRFYIKAPFYCLQSYLTVSECLGEGGCHFQTRGNLGFVVPSIATPTTSLSGTLRFDVTPPALGGAP